MEALIERAKAKADAAKQNVDTAQNVSRPKKASGNNGLGLVVFFLRAHPRFGPKGDRNVYTLLVLGIRDSEDEEDLLDSAELPVYVQREMSAQRKEEYLKELAEKGPVSSFARNKKFEDEKAGAITISIGTVFNHTSFNNATKSEIHFNPETKTPFTVGDVALARNAFMRKPHPKTTKKTITENGVTCEVDAVVEYESGLVFDDITSFPKTLVQPILSKLPQYLRLPYNTKYAPFCIPSKPNFGPDEYKLDTTKFTDLVVPNERTQLVLQVGEENAKRDTIAALKMVSTGVLIPDDLNGEPQSFTMQLNARASSDGTTNALKKYKVWNIDLWCEVGPVLLKHAQALLVGTVQVEGSESVQVATGLDQGRMGDVNDIIIQWRETLQDIGLQVSPEFIQSLNEKYLLGNKPVKDEDHIVNLREYLPAAPLDHYNFYIVFTKTRRELTELFDFLPLLPRGELYDQHLRKDQPANPDWMTYQLKVPLALQSKQYVIFAEYVGEPAPSKKRNGSASESETKRRRTVVKKPQ